MPEEDKEQFQDQQKEKSKIHRKSIRFRHPRIERMVSEREIDVGGKLFPMAGVSFLILLILVMGARDLMSKTKIKVEIPRAKRIEAELEEHIAITLTMDGKVFLNDVETTFEELPTKLEALEREDPDSTFWYTKLVLIRADKRLPFGEVLKALDASKKAKSQRVAFAVIKEKTSIGS